MLFSTLIIAASAIVSITGHPTLLQRQVDPSIVPEFGFKSGVNPTGTGDCDGAPGTNVKIPCGCPPDRALFLKDLNANIDAGRCVNNTAVSFRFPTDNSLQSQIDRITGVLITLQNLRGPGVGCPAASTTLVAERKKLQDQLDASRRNGQPAKPASTPAKARPSPSPAKAKPQTNPAPAPVKTSSTPASKPASNTNQPAPNSESQSEVARLAPDLGFVKGKNPTGTGDCDGAIPGGPKIPCSCPPDRAEFIRQLEANVAAGKAVHNPNVKVSYPLDNSVNSQKARIIASLITIQNLKGPGVGCPAVSTTLSAQLSALG